MTTLQATRTQYVDAANGVRFAFRQLGTKDGIPLVLHIHYRGNMDYWDPLLINALAATRPVIIFDQSGVGRSSGEVATSFQGWAANVIALCDALHLNKIDLLGFSMGGAAVQMVALTAPQLVRKLIVAGTTASQPPADETGEGIVWPRVQPPKEHIEMLAADVKTADEAARAIAFSFFYDTDAGRQSAKKYWDSIQTRNVIDEPLILTLLDHKKAENQFITFGDWITPNTTNSFERLHELKMPVLVLNGDDDRLIPTTRSWELHARIPGSQLIIYPVAGHGFIWQHAEWVATDVARFLDGVGDDRLMKL
ncbi:alpha/beta-hydrolase [Microthyrium microscopicum]|uniref:Alpha/beta-hydrolase n=1 Tax=Microthyrium microscopicum TaxID=703497 RepID=A0A6A6UPS1_9PEZI|nr:alpha/beta-hydrolase [Microthyrium microscopicum]